MPDSQIRLRCSEIWGGIRDADVDVCTNGLTASLYASASGAAQGGDIYYFAVCSSDMLTRIVIADLRGHGADASELSEWVYRALRDSMNTRDGNVVLKHLNSLLYQHGFTALTTAAVVGFYAADSHLYVSSAGHPPTLLRCRDGGPWRAVEITSSGHPANLPLGVFAKPATTRNEFSCTRAIALFFIRMVSWSTPTKMTSNLDWSVCLVCWRSIAARIWRP